MHISDINLEKALSRLRKFTGLTGQEHDVPWDKFSSTFQLFTAGRKQILTKAGEIEKYMYFVLEGVQRVVYYGEDGREATLVFTYAPSFGGVIDSMLLQGPSRYFYETLTPSLPCSSGHLLPL